MAAITEDRVREIAEAVIAAHTVDAQHRAYFAPADDRLITYAYYRSIVQELQFLGYRIAKLERPWYKRIFS